MITPVGQNNGVSFTSGQETLINATKGFKEYYFAKPQYFDKFNANTVAITNPGAKNDLSMYTKASEILTGLQQKIIALLPDPKAAEKVKVNLDQVNSSTFITVRKGWLRGLGLGKKTEGSMLELGADGKSKLLPMTQDTLAKQIANAITESIKK